MKFRLIWLHTLLIVMLAITNALRQDTASVTGTVTDPSGATVANAKVAVSSAERGLNRPTKTNSDGEYSVPSLPSGTYDLTVTARDSRSFRQKP